MTVTAGWVRVLELIAASAGALLLGSTGMLLTGLRPALSIELSALLFLGVEDTEVVGA